MLNQLSENIHGRYLSSFKIVLLFLVILISLSVVHCFAQSIESEIAIEQNDPTIEKFEKSMIDNNEDAILKKDNDIMVEGEEEAIMESQDEKEIEIPKDEYHYNPLGKRDPFYSKLLVQQKKLEPNKQLFGVQRYELAELKLVGIIWGDLGRKGVVETPDGKAYMVKIGTPIGKKDGVVKAITNQEVVIQEFASDYLGNRIENVSILKIHHKEQEQ